MNRISVVALAAVALLLVACPKKKPGGDDGGTEGGAMPVATDTTAATDSGPATPVGTIGGGIKPVVHADGGMDSGAGDGGMHAADASVPDLCCCKVGTKLSHATQSDCTTTLKGVCAKKEECDAKSCCCNTNGVKLNKLQSECSTGHGACIKKDECK